MLPFNCLYINWTSFLCFRWYWQDYWILLLENVQRKLMRAEKEHEIQGKLLKSFFSIFLVKYPWEKNYIFILCYFNNIFPWVKEHQRKIIENIPNSEIVLAAVPIGETSITPICETNAWMAGKWARVWELSYNWDSRISTIFWTFLSLSMKIAIECGKAKKTKHIERECMFNMMTFISRSQI